MRWNRSKRKFTNKKTPEKGVKSTILGVVAVLAVTLCIFSSFKTQGAENGRYGATTILALLFAIYGLILGVRSYMEVDAFKVFPSIGIILNALTILASGFVMYAGLFGI